MLGHDRHHYRLDSRFPLRHCFPVRYSLVDELEPHFRILESMHQKSGCTYRLRVNGYLDGHSHYVCACSGNLEPRMKTKKKDWCYEYFYGRFVVRSSIMDCDFLRFGFHFHPARLAPA